MKTGTITFTFILLFVLAWSGCNSSGTKEGQMENSQATATADSIAMADSLAASKGTSNQGDADALVILNTINQHEIDVSAEAQKRKMSQAVIDYAKMMQKEHSENMTKTNEVASSLNVSLMENDSTRAMKSRGEAMLTSLKSMDDKAFEKAYVDHMVKDHTDALATLDKQLQMVTSDAVKNHLTETRGHVTMHLEQATKLKGMQK